MIPETAFDDDETTVDNKVDTLGVGVAIVVVVDIGITVVLTVVASAVDIDVISADVADVFVSMMASIASCRYAIHRVTAVNLFTMPFSSN